MWSSRKNRTFLRVLKAMTEERLQRHLPRRYGKLLCVGAVHLHLLLIILVFLLTISSSPTSPLLPFLPLFPTTHIQENRHVGISISSGGSGWSLELGHCLSCPPAFSSPSWTPEGKGIQNREAAAALHSTMKVSLPSRVERGVALTVLNQRNASVIFQKVFPLWQYWAHWADLEWHMRRVAHGRVVILAVSVDGLVGLRHAILLFTRLGSLLASHLPPRAYWVWVFVKGGRTLAETALTTSLGTHQVHLLLPLLDTPLPVTHMFQGRGAVTEDFRWQYCSRHGVMGGLCDEYSPDLLPLPPTPKVTQQSFLAHVPVVVTAGTRQPYLYHTLTTILTAPGVEPLNVLVVLGHESQSAAELLLLLNVSYVTLSSGGATNEQLFQFYRDVFQLVAQKFSDAPYVIILDEDVEISPDFFSFMSQTLPLLQTDSSLSCVTGHAAEGFLGLAHDDTRVFRGSLQVQWGYGVTLDFVRKALSLWKATSQNTLLYDFWLYITVQKDSECIFPEVSRTRHFGMGVNTNAFLKERGPVRMPLVRQAPVALRNVHRLRLDMWQEDLVRNISSATFLQGNPCLDSFLPSPPSSPSYVFYYRLEKSECCGMPEPYQYSNAVRCLGLWWLSEQGHHRGVTIARFASNATMFLVGCPYSPYCYLRPAGLPPWDVDALTESEFKRLGNFSPRGSPSVTIKNENANPDSIIAMLSDT